MAATPKQQAAAGQIKGTPDDLKVLRTEIAQPWSQNEVPLFVRSSLSKIFFFGGLSLAGLIAGVVFASMLV